MKKVILSIILIATVVISPKKAMAWGRKGHSLVAEIAFHYLDENTKKNVLKYLNGMSIEDAASWMDDQRSDKSFDYLKPYHYINIEKGETYNAKSTNNIVTELNHLLEQLNHIGSLKDDDVRQDILELFHLIGDLHQPLHCGYGIDKGGNTYQVQFNGTGSNLHKVWDSELIDYDKITLDDCIDKTNIVSDNNDINVLEWMKKSESFVGDIYPENHKIDERYIKENTIIIKHQLLLAGQRLARVLEHYFKSITREPVFTKATETTTIINIDEALQFEGKLVIICTKVFGAKKLSSGGKPTFLNCGAAYPNSPLTILIWEDKLINFKHNPEEYYTGKNICVTGRVVNYKNKPEIIISKEDEIEIKDN